MDCNSEDETGEADAQQSVAPADAATRTASGVAASSPPTGDAEGISPVTVANSSARYQFAQYRSVAMQMTPPSPMSTQTTEPVRYSH